MNKPGIISDIKVLLNQRKKAFNDGDAQEIKGIQKELRVLLRKVKEHYRRKIEQNMQTITGCSSKRAPIVGELSKGKPAKQLL